MITNYNKQHFARLLTKSVAKMVTQGFYGLGDNGCAYLTDGGHSCIVGQLVNNPADPNLPPMAVLSTDFKSYPEFKATLEHDLECEVDQQMSELLEALQLYHDKAGRAVQLAKDFGRGPYEFTLEHFKAFPMSFLETAPLDGERKGFAEALQYVAAQIAELP